MVLGQEVREILNRVEVKLINKNMGQRRMFSPQIIDSDAFLDMPSSAQSLYFHLGMRADDDGFVGNPRKILKITNSSEDDLKILFAKSFTLTFESGIIVIKHWRINNLIRKDWYKETAYLEEKSLLNIKENGAYTLEEKENLVNENVTKLTRRLGKVRLGKDRNTSQEELKKQFWSNSLFKRYQQIYPNRDYDLCFEEMCQWYLINKSRLPQVITAFGKWLSNTKPTIELSSMPKSSAEETKQKLADLMK